MPEAPATFPSLGPVSVVSPRPVALATMVGHEARESDPTFCCAGKACGNQVQTSQVVANPPSDQALAGGQSPQPRRRAHHKTRDREGVRRSGAGASINVASVTPALCEWDAQELDLVVERRCQMPAGLPEVEPAEEGQLAGQRRCVAGDDRVDDGFGSRVKRTQLGDTERR